MRGLPSLIYQHHNIMNKRNSGVLTMMPVSQRLPLLTAGEFGLGGRRQGICRSLQVQTRCVKNLGGYGRQWVQVRPDQQNVHMDKEREETSDGNCDLEDTILIKLHGGLVMDVR